MAKRVPDLKSDELELGLGEANAKQRLFYLSRRLYTCYGGARGGGKSHAIRVKALGGALRWPGIRILILRRTYPELESSVVGPMLSMAQAELYAYSGALHLMTFFNGSTVKFGHFRAESSTREYQGQEYDWIFMDEATQFTEEEFRTLGGCLRGVNGVPKRFYLTCNPGGVGHGWVKRLFIDRAYDTDDPDPERREDPDDYAFIFATVDDNRALLLSSPAYLRMLSSLPEDIRRAHRYGDWDALAGRFFPEFNGRTHTADPFRIPSNWARYRAFDYGLDMFACLWIAVDTGGRCWVYREARRPGLIVSEAAALMRELTLPDERIEYTIAPPDMWSTQKDTGLTMAEIFMRNGIGLVRANNSRVQGWLMLKELLKPMGDGRPGLMVFSDCRGLIGDLPALQHSGLNPSDCATEPHGVTHAPDALRYFAQLRTSPGMRPEPEEDSGTAPESYDGAMTGGAASRGYLGY